MHTQSLYKGCLEPIILQLLKNNDKLYGYQITQMVKQTSQGKLIITEGALYPLLHKLEEKGLVQTELAYVDNRQRKYYMLTDTGIQETKTTLTELKSLIETLQLIINPSLA